MEASVTVSKTLVEEIGIDMNNKPSRQLVVRTFMTHDMKDEDIAALSTGREKEFRRIMDAIHRSRRASPGSLQHVALYGSRGFGKSFMTRRVQIEVGKLDDDVLGPVVYILLPEEQHNLQRSPHAFLDFIALKLAHNEDDTAYAAALFQWPKTGQEEKLWNDATEKLEQAINAALPGGNGLIVAVVENFDVLLATLFKPPESEQRLRLWLDRPRNRVMLFATATGTVDINYDRPLFQAFEPVRLSPWFAKDCINYFNRQRAQDSRPPLDSRQEAKARAITDFIGGTPRLAQLLGEVLDTQDALTVAETMSALADKLAEYYRRRIEDLTGLGRGLLDALIRGGEPASQTALAERVGADGQKTIARVMNDLQKADIIRGRSAPDSRETLYSVTDRVFVHYYRMRQGSQAAQLNPLSTILDFLKSFYTREEQHEQALRHLEAGRPAEASLFSRLALEGLQNTAEGAMRFGSRLSGYAELAPELDVDFLLARLNEDPARAYDHCAHCEPISQTSNAILTIVKAQALSRMGHTEPAIEILKKARLTATNEVVACIILLDELACLLVDGKPAAEYLLQLPKLDIDKLSPRFALRYISFLAWSFIRMGHYEEGLERAKQANDLGMKIGDLGEGSRSLTYMTVSLREMKRYEEALRCAQHAVDLASDANDMSRQARALQYMAAALGDLERHEEAVIYYERAAALSHQINNRNEEASSLKSLAFSLCKLGKYEQAWQRATESLDIARYIHDKWCLAAAAREALLVSVHLARPQIIPVLNDWIEAFKTSDEATELEDPRNWLHYIFNAAARARVFVELDSFIELNGHWFAETIDTFFIYSGTGEIIARVAEAEGRLAGYEAAAGLISRIAAYMTRLPEAKRDELWLPDLISGFTEKCKDPGLLRDVASLLTDDLAPQAAETATLLQKLADVDEAANPETVLARTDPDVATLIRRLRELPDPSSVRQKRKRASHPKQ